MELYGYDKIKILISELIANLKMYTLYQEGNLAGYIDNFKELLIISVVNYDMSIRRTLECKQKMNFLSDFDAIMWALKRTNTTRNSDESGGLGLYLLRKYIYELQAQCMIISGKCFLILDERSFDIEDENRIEYKEYKEMPYSYAGNIITLILPLKMNYQKKDDIENTSGRKISLGDIYGLFN